MTMDLSRRISNNYLPATGNRVNESSDVNSIRMRPDTLGANEMDNSN